MRYGSSKERTCAECGKVFYLTCLPTDYTFRRKDYRKDSPTHKQILYFCGPTCKGKHEREYPRKTYPKYNGG